MPDILPSSPVMWNTLHTIEQHPITNWIEDSTTASTFSYKRKDKDMKSEEQFYNKKLDRVVKLKWKSIRGNRLRD